MNNLSLANRLKAHLTRSDRLTDATALLQRMLANRTASEAPFTSGTSADAPGVGVHRRPSGRTSRTRLSTGLRERLSPVCPTHCVTSWTASDSSAPPLACHPALTDWSGPCRPMRQPLCPRAHALKP